MRGPGSVTWCSRPVGDDLLEEERWGGAGDDEVHELVLDGDHGFLAGQTSSWGEGGYDALIVRFGMRPWRFPE